MPSVVCYADPKKARTSFILKAFLKGCGGGDLNLTGEYQGGPSVFFGVTPHTRAAYIQARNSNDYDWYYIDNGYFHGLYRGKEYYRITRNALQYTGPFDPDFDRLRNLSDVKILPQKKGNFILFCPPTEFWMVNTFNMDRNEWRRSTLAAIKENTDLPVVERMKPKNVQEFTHFPSTIALKDAHAVVTFMSNIAVEGVLAGVPAFVANTHCAASISYTDLTQINDAVISEDREVWAATLAGRQWTLAEISKGLAWDKINGEG
jgi:hypothetical protein